MLNPLLERLAPYEQIVKMLPASGNHINAAFSKNPAVIEECVRRTAAVRGSDPKFAAAAAAARSSGIIVVYQAFNDGISQHAVQNQSFLGFAGYSPTRMTWIKTSMTWMCYRSEWNTRDQDQSRTLAITIPISLLDDIMRVAVHSGAHEDGEGGGSAGRAADDGGDVHEQKKQDAENEPEKAAHSAANATRQQQQQQQQPANKIAPAKKSDPTRLQHDPDHTPCGGNLRRRAIQLGMRGKSLEKWHALILCIDDVTESIVVPSRPQRFALQAATSKWRCGSNGADAGAPLLSRQQKQEQKQQTTAKDAVDGNSTSSAAAAAVGIEKKETVCLIPIEEIYVPSDEIVMTLGLDRAITTVATSGAQQKKREDDDEQ